MSPKIPSLLPGGRSLFALFACSVSASAEIVINEIHYNGEPNNVPNEFIELHNTGADPVDISGWFFNDGVDFTFPPGSVISAGGYAVVAEDPATLLALAGVDAFGPYAGALSGKGEAIELRRADGTRADTVDYRDGFPWPIASDGEGASMELINPALDNDLGGSWRSSSVPGVLPEITLLPASASGWRWRGGATEASAPIDAWRQPGFVEDGSWSTKAMPIGFGAVGPSADRLDFDPEIGDMRGNYTTVFLRNEFQIAPGEVPPTLQLRFRFDDGFAVWINGTEVHRENVAAGAITIASIAEGSTPSEELWYDTTVSGAPAYLVEGTNTIAIQLLNSSAGSSDCGMDFELIRPPARGTRPSRRTPPPRSARSITRQARRPPTKLCSSPPR